MKRNSGAVLALSFSSRPAGEEGTLTARSGWRSPPIRRSKRVSSSRPSSAASSSPSRPRGSTSTRRFIDYLQPRVRKAAPFPGFPSGPSPWRTNEVFRKADFWKAQASAPGRSLFVTGKAELSRETRKSVLGRPRPDIDEPDRRKRGLSSGPSTRSTGISISSRGDSGEIVLRQGIQGK